MKIRGLIIIISAVIIIIGAALFFFTAGDENDQTINNITQNEEVTEAEISDDVPFMVDSTQEEVPVDDSLGYPDPDHLTGREVIDALTQANIPLGEVIFYTEETDPEGLLLGPQQYFGKAAWRDQRIDQQGEGLRGGIIEVFFAIEDLEKRYEAINDTTEYKTFTYKNIIFYLDPELSEEHRAEYEKAVSGL